MSCSNESLLVYKKKFSFTESLHPQLRQTSLTRPFISIDSDTSDTPAGKCVNQLSWNHPKYILIMPYYWLWSGHHYEKSFYMC